MKADCVTALSPGGLSPDTMKLVLELHEWPDQLDQHIQMCENKHDLERRSLEKELIRRRHTVELEV